MGTQQLDLFAAYEPAPVREETLPVEAQVPEVIVEEESMLPAAPEAEESPAMIVASPSFEEVEDMIVAEDAPPEVVIDEVIVAPPPVIAVTPPVRESVVFADEKIGVKIKPKVSVQMPKTVVQPEQQEAAPPVKTKGKRGRKSYKEIDAELDLVEVPDEAVLNQKMYYSITEVARWFRVNASLLRYWENEFDILKPRKNRKGDRLFRPEDVKNLQVIYYLLRNRKFSLEGAKKYLRNHRQQADVNVQLAQSLTKFRSFLLELKANLGA